MLPRFEYPNWVAACFFMGLAPSIASAQPMELSQTQLRQLVTDQQILGAEAIVEAVALSTPSAVMDIRGFLDDGRMTYRVLLQRNDGAVVEIMVDGQNGQRVSHQSDLGQAVSAAARSHRVSATRGGGANNASSRSKDATSTARERRSETNRGNSGKRGNGGNAQGRGNGRG